MREIYPDLWQTVATDVLGGAIEVLTDPQSVFTDASDASEPTVELANKIALVTVSSLGIGAAVARTFTVNRAFAILLGRGTDALATVDREISDAGAERPLDVARGDFLI
jgi:hypothetical protein